MVPLTAGGAGGSRGFTGHRVTPLEALTHAVAKARVADVHSANEKNLKALRKKYRGRLTFSRQVARQEATLMLAEREAVASVTVPLPIIITVATTATADGGDSPHNIFSSLD